MSSELRLAIKSTIPVMFGYIPLGIAFGLLFVKCGAAWYLAPLMSMIVFAGAAQFIAITVLYAHGSLLSLALSTLLVNLRHIFYGISFVGKFPNRFFKKNYMIFGLTDESYSILTSSNENTNESYYFWVILFSHGYWIAGSLVGAALANVIHYNLSFMKFALTALFTVLTIEQSYNTKSIHPLFIGLFTSLIGAIFFHNEMLLVSIGLTTFILTLQFHNETNHE